MIMDFTRISNSYDKNKYTTECFAGTPCPKCPAIGRFSLHGSYQRHIVYFCGEELVHELIDIKRVKCQSCKSTHGVMPGDLVPYKLLSFFVLVFICTKYYAEKTPALKLADFLGSSFQFIYSCLYAFALHIGRIHQYFMESWPTGTPLDTGPESVAGLIKQPYMDFQSGYTKSWRRPCFMCKFFSGDGGPPVGIYAPAGAAT